MKFCNKGSPGTSFNFLISFNTSFINKGILNAICGNLICLDKEVIHFLISLLPSSVLRLEKIFDPLKLGSSFSIMNFIPACIFVLSINLCTTLKNLITPVT